MTDTTRTARLDGLPQALGAHAFWGVMPLYLVLVRTVHPIEFVAWRVVWTLPICLAVLAWRRQWSEVRAAFAHRRSLLLLIASSTLVGINWVAYVLAVDTGHVFAASLGYYILPLVMMLLGLVVLGEKLTAAQWGAVALAAAGVSLLAIDARTTLWLSMTVAVTFGSYGLIRKVVAVGALAGLTVETLLLYLPALGIATWFGMTPAGSAMAQSPGLSASILLGGVMTAVPLMLFATAARRMNYTTIGFLQFLSPTMVFVLGLTWFHEELKPAQLGCFVLIWSAMALFVWDLLRVRRKKATRTATS